MTATTPNDALEDSARPLARTDGPERKRRLTRRGLLTVGIACVALVGWAEGRALLSERARDRAIAAHQERAVEAAGKSDFPRALSALQAAQQLAPGRVDLQDNLMRLQIRMVAERPESLRTIDSTYFSYVLDVVGRDEAPSLAAAGQLMRFSGEPRAALALFRQATERDATYLPAYVAAGTTERELGDLTEAQRAYERARDVAPSDPAVLNNLGVVYADLGRQSDAVATLTRALEVSETAATRVNLADALSQMDRHAEALEHLRKATVLEPRSADLWRRLGMTLFDQGDLEGAQRALETAVSLSHAPATALELARVHLARKQLPEAASVQQQVLAAEPTNVEAAFALGETLHELGDHAGSAQAMERYLSLSAGRSGEGSRRAAVRELLVHLAEGHEHAHEGGSHRH